MDPLSFAIGFVAGILFTWLLSRSRPLLTQIRENAKEQRQAAQTRRTSGLEDNHRRITLRRAQGMHLAASLFSLDEILQEPRLIAPPARVEPGVIGIQEDIISQTLPYMPAWPELAAIYRAPTLGVVEAIRGGSNIVIVGAAGMGKTVALAHLASLAANLQVKLDTDSELEAVPYLYHVADLQFPFDTSKDPVTTIINAASEHAPIFDLRRLPGFIQQTFKNGQALLLIDGFDELDPTGQKDVVEWFKALLQTHPKIRIVTTGCVDQLNGLISLGFNPLALISWGISRSLRFIQQWGELWSRTVALEAWAQTGPGQVDPVLLNTWLTNDNHGLTPFELTLKAWGAYAGDSLGPRVLDAIATHVRRVAPSGTPVAALELLAMQVVLTSQPIFDPRQARGWVKQYDIVEDKPIESAETVTTEAGEEVPLTDSQKIRIKKSKAGEAGPTYGLLSKMVESGLLISHSNNKMRFLHPRAKWLSCRSGHRRQRRRHNPAGPSGLGWKDAIPAIFGCAWRCIRGCGYYVERVKSSASQLCLLLWRAGCAMRPGKQHGAVRSLPAYWQSFKRKASRSVCAARRWRHLSPAGMRARPRSSVSF